MHAPCCFGQLQRNSLTTLPVSFGDIGTLEELDISHNDIAVQTLRALLARVTLWRWRSHKGTALVVSVVGGNCADDS